MTFPDAYKLLPLMGGLPDANKKLTWRLFLNAPEIKNVSVS